MTPSTVNFRLAFSPQQLVFHFARLPPTFSPKIIASHRMIDPHLIHFRDDIEGLGINVEKQLFNGVGSQKI